MRSSSRKGFARKKKGRLAHQLLKKASKGAKSLINQLLENGITIDLLKLTRSGSKGNIIKQDVQDFADPLLAAQFQE